MFITCVENCVDVVLKQHLESSQENLSCRILVLIRKKIEEVIIKKKKTFFIWKPEKLLASKVNKLTGYKISLT